MAKKKNQGRELIGLVYEPTGERLYYTTIKREANAEEFRLRKYHPGLRKHVEMVKTKKNLGRNVVKKRK